MKSFYGKIDERHIECRRLLVSHLPLWSVWWPLAKTSTKQTSRRCDTSLAATPCHQVSWAPLPVPSQLAFWKLLRGLACQHNKLCVSSQSED